jgi:hypothetical protein
MIKNMETLMTILQLDQPSWLLLQLRKILIFIPTFVLQIVLIFLLFKICLLIYHAFYKPIRKRKLFWFCFLTVTFGFLIFKQQKILQTKVALVVKEFVFVYAGPEQSFHTIFQLKSGTYVQLLEKQENMCQIMTHGHRGWIETDSIEIL